MSTRSNKPEASTAADPTGASPFGGLGAGFDFFQQWMKAASSAMPGMGSAATQGATAWAMPTLDPEELEKRIQELQTVQFWLEQNARMLGMTIQTLEVQRMTLQTLKGMKVPMDALRESLRAQAPFAAAAATAPPAEPVAAPAPVQAAPTSDNSEASTTAEAPALGVNPMQWWSTLTEQFATLASQTVQAGQDAMNAAAASVPAAKDTSADDAPSSASPDGAPARGRGGAATPRGEDGPSGSDGRGGTSSAPASRPRAATQIFPKTPGGKTPRR